VLGIGCGTGQYVLALAEARFDVMGIDLASEMLKQAKWLSSTPPIRHAQEWGPG
jgi:2-polyprenyl-3-methyl-5-hydroxy-6-metoxy-1,4-benzoquinol methylase